MEKVSLINIIKLNALFLKNGWEKEYNGVNLFDEFANTFGLLTESQTDMILHLSKEYELVSINEYSRLFVESFDKAMKVLEKKEAKHVIIVPLLPEKDFGRIKSSKVIWYQIKAIKFRIDEKYPKLRISLIDCPSNVKSIKENECLCLVDDFVGTGDTAKEAVEYFVDKGICKDKIIIVTLFSMEEGSLKIKKGGISIFSARDLKKGISDRTDGNKSNYLLEMRRLEEQMGFKNKYLSGYGKSEALITLWRTPNNTFPIYWCKNNQNTHPPFRRI